MGWSNGPPSWSELERVLSGRPGRHDPDSMYPGDGGDSPAWSRKRGEYLADGDDVRPLGPVVPYAELHAHSAYSFLDGASHPEELVEEAARLGLEAIALTDHNGFYGAVRFFEAAREWDIATVYGAELTLAATESRSPVDPPPHPSRPARAGLRSLPVDAESASAEPSPRDTAAPRPHSGAPDSAARTGEPDPPGVHLLVLARGQEGYRRLSREIAAAHMAAGEKGILRYDLDTLTAAAGGHWQILTGCRKGALRQALEQDLRAGSEPVRAEAALRDLVERFGAERVSVELTHHGLPADDERNAHLIALADRLGLPVVATTGAHFASPAQRHRAMALAAIRSRSSLDEMAGWLAPTGGAHLRSGAEMARLFADCPQAVANAVALARECAFDLKLIAPELPPFPVPEGHDENSWLRELTLQGAAERYGAPQENPAAYRQIEHELAVITGMKFPGYFLVVHDIVTFCKNNGILCQGRGSAANSAVCYAIGITNVDPVRNNLLFERFLSPARDGPPDIDIDIESDRREEAIQHVYHAYGREYAAQVANVITYRGKSAVRDAARALGFSTGQQDAWSKQVSRWTGVGAETGTDIPERVLELAADIEGLPRHLGIHSGGMVICDRPIADVCPVEWARMPGRSVLQWDKDDCAAAGLVKFDLLGLGMLSALHYMIDLVREHEGVTVELHKLDLAETAVYEMLSKADSIGVFQVESRAQMATLPRLKPREFYDLVVEVALIRPGPIQGGSVHPYIRRRNGQEDWDFDHPSLQKTLARTYGVPLFQEQLMQIAVDVAGFTAAEADQLRRAMGSKRSPERMERLKARLYQGMRDLHGITGEVADRIYEKLYAFANFGFPESHSQSFAALVFYSAWFKLHHPAAFCAGLLRAQPMGFYSPQSLVADARRHGVVVHGPDINASRAEPTLEQRGTQVRLGLAAVRYIGAELAEKIVAAREESGPYTSLLDLTGRVELTVRQAESLATAGALDSVTTVASTRNGSPSGAAIPVRAATNRTPPASIPARSEPPPGGAAPGASSVRRTALWAAGAAAAERSDRLPGLVAAAEAPALPGMSALELAAADVWATGISPGSYPTEFLRAELDAMGVIPADRLLSVPDGSRVLVGGAVTHRQRPATAAGVTFLNLEDETGMVNIVCSVGLWTRYRRLAQTARALIIRGRIQNAEGAVSVYAETLRQLDLRMAGKSRDFR
ncbi:error-prone DNA polymerase [Nocardia cyriacigeorgica]|uniref:error-prone DNA polymerase n=1 Tax=Nocardia cyriacigeorgica TaxID=135487 RepID=UPI0018955132|nr:error-prone DNA polymerase [Nocardia cyriacigeorgica]MBF6438740.1 error-prone DNA polymerase [Nocardia cyriacigeorgica]MBF6456648.1 error-prone DNA polymerase [Nocardia cyriacigeorgica]MBF6479097.1 error-prone DNA polymerase [Nocardia cyriacigeorgica]MBF6551453.1 error-prone DNA polymerase [Nocardia cyriacigeorgica]